MSQQLCRCATECEWLESMYKLPHHPDCPVIAALVACLPKSQHRPHPHGEQPNECVVRFTDVAHSEGPAVRFGEWNGHALEDCCKRFPPLHEYAGGDDGDCDELMPVRVTDDNQTVRWTDYANATPAQDMAATFEKISSRPYADPRLILPLMPPYRGEPRFDGPMAVPQEICLITVEMFRRAHVPDVFECWLDDVKVEDCVWAFDPQNGIAVIYDLLPPTPGRAGRDTIRDKHSPTGHQMIIRRGRMELRLRENADGDAALRAAGLTIETAIERLKQCAREEGKGDYGLSGLHETSKRN